MKSRRARTVGHLILRQACECSGGIRRQTKAAAVRIENCLTATRNAGNRIRGESMKWKYSPGLAEKWIDKEHRLAAYKWRTWWAWSVRKYSENSYTTLALGDHIMTRREAMRAADNWWDEWGPV